jgi:putative phosphoesterase
LPSKRRQTAIAVIADTHLPRGSRALPAACVDRLRSADLIVHAGDFVAWSVYDELVALGPPLVAVHGNQDDAKLRALLPAERVIEAGGARVGLIHDAGPARGRLERMRRLFPDVGAVVFGHSHIPLHETAADGFQIFNPGSPTDRRRQPLHTMGVATAEGGSVRFDLIRFPAT